MTRIFERVDHHPWRDRHHHGVGRFRNPPSPHPDGRGSAAMRKVLWTLAREGNRPLENLLPGHVWSRDQALAALRLTLPPTLTWLGQACFYIRLPGTNLLADPFLGERASPVPFAGPRRLVPQPLVAADLDPDVLLISHNHYDHLDRTSIRTLCGKRPVTIVTTLGTGRSLRGLGAREVIELDWLQCVELGEVLITLTPACHFSGRSAWDQDRALWGGFFVESDAGRLFFAGDSGDSDCFDRTAELLGGADVALVPAGAYGPPEVFARVHMTPEEARQVADRFGAREAVAMHWGTLRLTTEPFWEPRERFLAAAGRAAPVVMAIGQTRPLGLAEPPRTL